MNKFTIYIREPKTTTVKNWFTTKTVTENDQVQHVVFGDTYAILQHDDTKVTRLIVKDEDRRHVFSCMIDDFHSLYINNVEENIDE